MLYFFDQFSNFGHHSQPREKNKKRKADKKTSKSTLFANFHSLDVLQKNAGNTRWRTCFCPGQYWVRLDRRDVTTTLASACLLLNGAGAELEIQKSALLHVQLHSDVVICMG